MGLKRRTGSEWGRVAWGRLGSAPAGTKHHAHKERKSRQNSSFLRFCEATKKRTGCAASPARVSFEAKKGRERGRGLCWLCIQGRKKERRKERTRPAPRLHEYLVLDSDGRVVLSLSPLPEHRVHLVQEYHRRLAGTRHAEQGADQPLRVAHPPVDSAGVFTFSGLKGSIGRAAAEALRAQPSPHRWGHVLSVGMRGHLKGDEEGRAGRGDEFQEGSAGVLPRRKAVR
jgi:hypothetical protein